MKLTHIDLNSWLLHIANQTILIDPWLVDPLVFYGQPWLFTAYHATPPVFTPDSLPHVDLILLSQGLDDHCHKPTLAKLDRNIPVVASPAATPIVKDLGYTHVTNLAPGQRYTVAELEIRAVAGTQVQPGEVENCYLLQDKIQGESLYYTPHCFRPSADIGTVDVAIAPVVGQVVPLLGQVIMGPKEAMQLVKTLQPRIFIPNAMGDIRASGLLPKFLQSVGSLEEFQTQLQTAGVATQLLTPAAGETLEL